MKIGIPKEIMVGEGRIALIPAGAKSLIEAKHEVLVQSRAGEKSGYSDKLFAEAGSLIKAEPQSIYQADLVVKVKEPQEEEYEFLKEKGILFAFLHLPANPKLVEVLQKKKLTAIAYEGVESESGERPILQPMSKIAGERAVREGFNYLAKDPKDAKVLVLGAGDVGQAAIKTAQALGADIVALDLPGKIKPHQSPKMRMEISSPESIREFIKSADLLIAAAVSPGKKAPLLITKEMLSSMVPGSVIVDVAIDEGGNVETSKPTTHNNPIFVGEGIIHYCVKNVPGGVPQVSTPALIKATLPYILEIANKGLEKAIGENPALAKGVHVLKGELRI